MTGISILQNTLLRLRLVWTSKKENILFWIKALVLAVSLYWLWKALSIEVFGKRPQSPTDCCWTKYTTSFFGRSVDMCVRCDSDGISKVVRYIGKWPDCDYLTTLVRKTKATNFLDIGANIGACVTAVLGTSQTVQIDAYEPHPQNFWYLQQTAGKEPRAHLHNFAFGSKKEVLKVAARSADNMGAAQIRGSDTFGDAAVDTFDADVQVYDDHEGRRKQHYDVVKVDVEGFECHVLCGALESITAGNWDYLRIEFLRENLVDAGCSVAALRDILANTGFTLFKGKDFVILAPDYTYKWKAENVKKDEAKKLCSKHTNYGKD